MPSFKASKVLCVCYRQCGLFLSLFAGLEPFAYCGVMKNAVSKFFMALRVLSKEFSRFRQPFPFFTCSVSSLMLLIETKEESPCSDNLLVTPSLTGAFHLKKKLFTSTTMTSTSKAGRVSKGLKM